MSAPYLISKIADPVFAFIIGSSSAVLRIQRDIRESASSSPSPSSASQNQTATTPSVVVGGMPQRVSSSSSSAAATAAAAAGNGENSDDASLSKIFETGSRRLGMWWRGEFEGL